MKLGNLNVPKSRLPDLLNDLRAIFDEYGSDFIGGTTKNDTLAHKVLGYEDSNNGTYRSKIKALREFGLIEGQGKDTQISSLGKTLLASEGQEWEKAYDKAAMRISLWNIIRHKDELGLKVSGFDSSIFIKTVMDASGCDEADAKSKEKFLLDAYDSDTKSIRGFGQPKKIEMSVNKQYMIYPFTVRGRNRAVAWLKDVRISTNETA
jgi:hypothetical protein